MTPAQPDPGTVSAPAPLSHHEVLVLSEPFARRGLRLDTAASDRHARRLIFHRVEEMGSRPQQPLLAELMQLESLGTGTCRLTRTVTGPGGAKATLQSLGSDLAALLARCEVVDPGLHFRAGEGWVLSRDYTLGGAGPVLSCGRVQLDGLRLTMTVSPVRGVAAELRLDPDDASLALPEDLLAVLGWDWARLIAARGGWTTRLRLRGTPARRTRNAEAALAGAAVHLARTLAEAPARFHERHLAARWTVVLRRAIPVLTPVALLITLLAMPKLDTSGGASLWWLLYHVPTVLIAMSFCLQELPRFEIPPLPRRSKQPAWSHSPSLELADPASS